MLWHKELGGGGKLLGAGNHAKQRVKSGMEVVVTTGKGGGVWLLILVYGVESHVSHTKD